MTRTNPRAETFLPPIDVTSKAMKFVERVFAKPADGVIFCIFGAMLPPEVLRVKIL